MFVIGAPQKYSQILTSSSDAVTAANATRNALIMSWIMAASSVAQGSLCSHSSMPHRREHALDRIRYPQTTKTMAPLKLTDETHRDDCVAGHVGLEPANPSASYLIGIL